MNSLGLTAVQPENNVYRILLEMLGVTMSKDARARAVQLPAWNEALGLPRAWDQQWSRRAQQILAFETDLLEYEDIFEGSKVIEEKTDEIADAAWAEYERVLELGGSMNAIDYMKEQLVAAHAKRVRAIESGEHQDLGVNAETQTEPSPLVPDEGDFHILKVTSEQQAEQIERLERFRGTRDKRAVTKALDALRAGRRERRERDARVDRRGEGRRHDRRVGGRAARGRSASTGPPRASPASTRPGRRRRHRRRARARRSDRRSSIGVGRIRMLVGKPGLDGHSNAAEQLAVRARDLGMEAVYPGIRLTPAQIAQMAADEDVHLIGLSILSGAHDLLIPEVMNELQRARRRPERVPVVVGGTIPDDDAKQAPRARRRARLHAEGPRPDEEPRARSSSCSAPTATLRANVRTRRRRRGAGRSRSAHAP